MGESASLTLRGIENWACGNARPRTDRVKPSSAVLDREAQEASRGPGAASPSESPRQGMNERHERIRDTVSQESRQESQEAAPPRPGHVQTLTSAHCPRRSAVAFVAMATTTSAFNNMRELRTLRQLLDSYLQFFISSFCRHANGTEHPHVPSAPRGRISSVRKTPNPLSHVLRLGGAT